MWPTLLRIVAPALKRDTQADAAGRLRDDLKSNRMAAWLCLGSVTGVIVVELCDLSADDPRKTLFVRYAAGGTQGRNGRGLREVVGLLCDAAKAAGCELARIGGRRGWRRLFRDWELISDDGERVELKKVL